jgi:hypothetical protein
MNHTASTTLSIEVRRSLADIEPAAWDALVRPFNPFMAHAWLRSLEVCGLVDGDTGWIPQYLTVWDGNELRGALPGFVKLHSYGEFVYDWAWANLAERIGEPYYPKLVVGSPFSPVAGPRILVDQSLAPNVRSAVYDALVEQAMSVVDERQATGLHFLFVPEADHDRLRELGLLTRVAHQYHWRNKGYTDFEDFLSSFKSKRRREIRRERRIVRDAGYTVETLSGGEMTPELIEKVYDFYADTTDRYMGGHRYLSREFFHMVTRKMPGHVRVFLARDPLGEVVAGTFNMQSEDTIYGRYWGSSGDVPFLHFETCYYSMIEYACEHGIQVIEPGAGGDHKYSRGFEPVATYSAHHMASPRMTMILEKHLQKEREYVTREIDAMLEHSPLRPRDVISLADGSEVEG